jgi:hypothetical protein
MVVTPSNLDTLWVCFLSYFIVSKKYAFCWKNQSFGVAAKMNESFARAGPTAVVFTVGSAFIACGFAGEAQPRHILSLKLHEVRSLPRSYNLIPS